jgi:phage gp29-like protein
MSFFEYSSLFMKKCKVLFPCWTITEVKNPSVKNVTSEIRNMDTKEISTVLANELFKPLKNIRCLPFITETRHTNT